MVRQPIHSIALRSNPSGAVREIHEIYGTGIFVAAAGVLTRL